MMSDLHYNYRLEVVVGTLSWDKSGYKKTPEINELESAIKLLKIWAHDFEKQKS